MKKLSFTIIAICFLTVSFGQKTELQVQLNSGLFSFAGKSAESSSSMNISDGGFDNYTNNPYGSKNALCIGVSGNIKRVTKKNFLFGTDLGFEVLRSKIDIEKVDGFGFQNAANGKTFLNSRLVNINPFFGYRIMMNKLTFDLTGGFDINYCLSTKEKGKATDPYGTVYKTSVDRKTIKSDVSPRFQIAMRYQKTGIYVGYSFGLANYKTGYTGGSNECFARLLRFGLTYQLK